jgi:hypothetical protein
MSHPMGEGKGHDTSSGLAAHRLPLGPIPNRVP